VNDTNNVHVSVGEVEALLPRREQVPGERYKHGERLRVYVVNVARGLKGPEIIVSRSHPELVRRLFEREVPELVSGAVSIMAIAREAGARSKIAVRANADGVNPKGALIGPGGARVRAVMENLGPEKIDIVDWSADPAKFVAAALSPAVATEVNVISEKNKTAIAFIHDDQLSLAIGKEGQNARLSAKLTGWKIGIESAEAHAKALQEAAAKQPAEPSDDANTSAKEPSTPEATSPAPTPSSENEAR
jgi:N utilization substance protein A